LLYSPPFVATPPTVGIWNADFSWYIYIGAAAAVITFSYLFYSIAKNRARPGREVPAFAEKPGDWGNWKSMLVIVVLMGSALAFVEYQTFASTSLVTVPNDPSALQIGVTARQWAWSFTYPNGYTDFQNMTVPVGQIVILNITSVDVTHGLFIPALDVGKDAQPGIYTSLWFNATQPGVFTIECRQLCGVGHALMLSKLVVVSTANYTTWYSKLPAAKAGA
jgi:cytochrome c oxidase subunit II